MEIYKVYKAKYADDHPAVIISDTDYDALKEALDKEDEHGPLLGLCEVCGDGFRDVV